MRAARARAAWSASVPSGSAGGRSVSATIWQLGRIQRPPRRRSRAAFFSRRIKWRLSLGLPTIFGPSPITAWSSPGRRSRRPMSMASVSRCRAGPTAASMCLAPSARQHADRSRAQRAGSDQLGDLGGRWRCGRGYDLSDRGNDIKQLLEVTRWVRPCSQGGAGTTVSVLMMARRH